jgi:hypothetical protein
MSISKWKTIARHVGTNTDESSLRIRPPERRLNVDSWLQLLGRLHLLEPRHWSKPGRLLPSFPRRSYFMIFSTGLEHAC